MSRIDDIKARLAAATPGRWRVANHGTWEVEASPNVLVADCGTIDHAKEDAALIANAPADLAYLLRVADLVRAYVEGAEAEGVTQIAPGFRAFRAALESE
jgi:hypothetical protein